MALEITETGTDDARVIAVSGEVDLYSSPDLREAITKAIPRSDGALVIDLGDVAYMDSSGVATLVEGLRAAKKKKSGFVLRSPSTAVMKVLQLSRLDTVFEVQDGA
ncbi:MAG: STAS domain-containing protein [bacterium]|nr:STAS domain-containing protein [bacterium]